MFFRIQRRSKHESAEKSPTRARNDSIFSAGFGIFPTGGGSQFHIILWQVSKKVQMSVFFTQKTDTGIVPI
jgi:hypothetical protein